jgi:hypothetical protein
LCLYLQCLYDKKFFKIKDKKPTIPLANVIMLAFNQSLKNILFPYIPYQLSNTLKHRKSNVTFFTYFFLFLTCIFSPFIPQDCLLISFFCFFWILHVFFPRDYLLFFFILLCFCVFFGFYMFFFLFSSRLSSSFFFLCFCVFFKIIFVDFFLQFFL